MNKILFFLLLSTAPHVAWSDDWPTYRSDASRSGYSEEELPEQLFLQWHYETLRSPRPAWPNSDRMTFDRASHFVISEGKLFFGSTVDCQVHALDATTGKPLWTFFTDGPVRFAPTVWKDRLFVVSDDGFLYALSVTGGKLLWKKRGAPRDRLILGNERMISRWPARGGPVVVGSTVYFASGIWPSDGLYLYALDAKTGNTVWLNNNSGSLEMDQPHGGARAKSGVAAQGYLVASENRLIVPTGRAVPAVFGLDDGTFEYFHLRSNGKHGGSLTMAAGSLFYNDGILFDSTTGKSIVDLGNGPVASWPEGMVHANEKRLTLYQWKEKETRDRKGTPVRYQTVEETWSLDRMRRVTSLIVSGETIVCGESDLVTLIDLETSEIRWSSAVEGTALALAVSNGQLYVGTDRGSIYCFGAKTNRDPLVIEPRIVPSPYGDNINFAKAAQEILQLTDVREGYCVDLGCGDGALAFELAKRTKLKIYAMDPDPKNVAEARRKLDAAGIYGSRVTVTQGDLNATAYPDSFADLVVSARSIDANSDGIPADELARLQRPFGGIACLGKAGNMRKSVRGELLAVGLISTPTPRTLPVRPILSSRDRWRCYGSEILIWKCPTATPAAPLLFFIEANLSCWV